MSRGLGKLQSAIVERMKVRAGVRCERRYGYVIAHPKPVIGGDFVQRRPPSGAVNEGILLAAGMHDMRRVAEEVAAIAKGLPVEEKRSLPFVGEFISRTRVERRNAMCAAFSRAVRGLEQRGVIEFPAMVPIEDLDDGLAHGCLFLADGTFINGKPRGRGQRRFARLIAPT